MNKARKTKTQLYTPQSAAAEISRLQDQLAQERELRRAVQVERDERTKVARHLMVMLGGATDGSPGGRSRKEIRALFNLACEQYPWCDPRNAADAAGGE